MTVPANYGTEYSALCSWFFDMYTRYRINSTQIYTYICEEDVCWVTTCTSS